VQSDYVEIYERLEREHWWWIARRRIIRSVLESLQAKDKDRMRLLDIGCGAGLGIASLRDRFDCTGIEPDSHLVQRARENTGVPILQSELPITGNLLTPGFNFILLLDVLEHVEDEVEALRSTFEYLAKDGYLIINVPAMPWLWSSHDEINKHYRRYLAKQLEERIHDAGLRLYSIRYWGSLLAPAAYFGRRLHKNSKTEGHDLRIPPRFVNQLLVESVVMEYWMTKMIRIPMGLSLLAVAYR
jgi:2-polyprenyl-3-methyl-5-hydroxy-6-metoxy-1,4-benzoquinol methylase